MSPDSSGPEQTRLDALRRHRAELRESMIALEKALAAPTRTGQGRWAERVHVALVELSADFHEHVEATEGKDGLYQDLRATAPRLSHPVARLTQEHTKIRALIDDLLAQQPKPESNEGMDRVRDLGTRLLGMLVRHRQRGSDLVYEAYEVDVGGET